MAAISFEEKVKHFLTDGDGDGSGYGSGYGSGDGDGDGSGYGSGSCSGYGDGDGDGSGSCSGYGYGDGDGDGDGYGDGILELNREKVYSVDGIPTIFRVINGNVAKGVMLKDDMTLVSCFVVKGNGHFAHGETLRSAMEALTDKLMQDMPEEDRISAFVRAHPEYRKSYPNQELYEWHHRLTGSCEMGRKNFIESKGLTLDGETSVEDFITLTENAYGGHIVRKLRALYEGLKQ